MSLVGRGAAIAVVFLSCLAVSGCRSSATTSTAPSPLVRCSLTLNTSTDMVPPQGGTGTIGVSTTRECTWTVAVEGSWLSLRSPQNGQGDGTVEFVAAANPDPVLRRGALVLNGQRAEITQAAGQCEVTLAETFGSFTPSGGTGRVDVRTSSTVCTWTAVADQPWIAITSGSEGRGSAAVTFTVAATTGPPRTGTITIAEQRFSVTQSEGCTFAIDPASHATSASGGSGSIAIATTQPCPWTASSNVSWMTLAPAGGSGPASVSFVIDPTSGPARTGTAVIAGQTFTVTQSPGCLYQVQPQAHAIGGSGGTGTVTVTSGSDCGWTASSDVPWISIQTGSSGQGSGSVTFSVAPTTASARSGTLTVAGQKVTITQGEGCSYTVTPTEESIPVSGGTARVTITAGDGCGWTASSDVTWITIQGAASGAGPGSITYSVSPANGPGRTGSLTVAGQKVTVTQGLGCTTSINPSQQSIASAGGSGSVAVTAADGCAWTALSLVPWISIVSGAAGSGAGTVQFTVAPNAGPSRTGTITAAGTTFTVNQGSGCSYGLSPASETVPGSGGNRTVAVSAAAGCTWTAASNNTWLSITGPASGSGDGSVAFTAAANTGPARSGTLTIAGRPFPVTQGAGCSYTVAPTTISAPAAAGPARVDVSAAAGCAWTATSSAPWVVISAGASGTGAGRVDLSIAANTGAARSAAITVAGHTVTVNQASGCTYTLSAMSITVPAAGGPRSVNVTAAPGCAWTAVSQVAWVVVTAGASGTGNGPVQFTVLLKAAGAPRSGTVLIAGHTFTVNQQ